MKYTDLPSELVYGDESGDQIKHDRHHQTIHSALNLRTIGAVYSDASFVVPITSIGVPRPVNGPSTFDPSSTKWVSGNNEGEMTLTAVNGDGVTGLFIASLSLGAEGNNQEIWAYAAVNGVIVPGTKGVANISAGGDIRKVVCVGLIEVTTGDEVRLYVENETSTGDITVVNYHYAVRT